MGDQFGFWIGIISILAFLFAVATTPWWGRNILVDLAQSLQAPFLGIRLVRMGIYEFFDSRTSLSRNRARMTAVDYLTSAKKEVGIIALSLNYSIVHQHLHEDLRKTIKQKDQLNVFVFLLNPNSPIISSAANASGRSADELRQYIRQSLSRLEEMSQMLDPSERSRLHLRLYDTYIANSILVQDPYEPNGRFLVENYLFKVPIQGRYSFECRRPGSPMYDKLVIAYEEFKKDFGGV